MSVCSDKEFKFLTSCISSTEDTSIPQLDWSRVRALTKRHRLTPLVYRKLRSLPQEDLPADILAEFEQKAIANAARNSFLCNEMLSILDTLNSADIPAIPFKGAILAADSYGDVSMRQFDDIDILIQKENISKAASILTSKGYSSFMDLPEFLLRKYADTGWGNSLKSPGTDYHVELISNVLPDFCCVNIPDNTIWGVKHETSFENKIVRTLSAETCITLLSIHGAKHLWERLSWVADIVAIIRANPEINWQTITELAENSGTMRILLLCLNLADIIAAPPIPADIKELIRKDKHVTMLTAQILESYTQPEDKVLTVKEEMSAMLQMRERATDKIRYLISILLTPSYSDWKTITLPPSLYPLYYLIRPFRLIFRSKQNAETRDKEGESK